MSILGIYVRFKWTLISVRDYFIFLFKYKKILSNNKKNILIFSHDASNKGGAPVVLINLLKNLPLNNYNVFIFFKQGGGLLKEAKATGYYPFVYQYLSSWYLKLLKKHTDCVLVNTVICADVVDRVQKSMNCPIVWWVHEEGSLFESMKKKLPKNLKSNVRLLCVSEVSKIATEQYLPQARPQIMFYGVEDSYQPYSRPDNSFFKICVVGMLSERKNQMQILDMLNCLPTCYREKIHVKVVAGTWNVDYKESFLNRLDDFPEVEFIAGLKHDEVLELYKQTDLLLCCSKQDPLPVVVTEALMMECLCLVSSGCGQYQYLKNGQNGYCYDVDSVSDLCSKIIEIMDNEHLNDIAVAGRQVYIKKFSMQHASSEMSKKLGI